MEYSTKDLIMNFRRMRNIKRCNMFPTLMPTDVAQHSYYVTMLAMLFNDEMKKFQIICPNEPAPQLDVSTLLRKAILHDTEEVFISDIPYNIKHHSDELHNELENITNVEMKNIMQDYVMTAWNGYREQCKTGTEGAVVALCDMLELAIYSYEEVSMGNTSMKVMLGNCNKYLDELMLKAVGVSVDDIEESEIETYIKSRVPTIYALREMIRHSVECNQYDDNIVIDI
jgi:5'-deoxynucleotidase YfbR-like HD superfamily hydrolase